MAVTEVKEDWRGLEAESGTDGASVPRTFTVQFDTDDDPEKRPILAITADDGTTKIPKLYETHSQKPWLFVNNHRVDPLGPFDFRVTAYYTNRYARGSEDKFDPTQHPLDQPWEVEWGFVTANEPIDRDINGEPITNSAGQSFDPPITRDVDDLVLKITRNKAAYDPIVASDYKGSVNSDTFWGFTPGLVKCTRFNARSARQADLWYWIVTYEFQMRKDGWKRRILDEGYAEKTGTDSDGKPTHKENKDDDNVNLSEPILLDGSGEKKKDTDPAVFLEFELYPSLPFSVLGL